MRRERTLQDDLDAAAKATSQRLDERYFRLARAHPELQLPDRSRVTDLQRNQILLKHGGRPAVTIPASNAGAPLIEERCYTSTERQAARCPKGATS